jgi:hypothetical protein
MKNLFTLLLLPLCLFTLSVHSQTLSTSDSASGKEKAKYLKEDITKALSTITNYPLIALQSSFNGDVIFSFTITKEGKLTDLSMMSSPNVLSPGAFNSMAQLENNWVPAKVKGVSVDAKYMVAFRFRCYMNSPPSDLKRESEGYVKRLKYDKALKALNEAIDDNMYDTGLFESRSKVKGLMGDAVGEKADHQTAITLSTDCMSVVNVVAIGTTRTVKTVNGKVVSNQRTVF